MKRLKHILLFSVLLLLAVGCQVKIEPRLGGGEDLPEVTAEPILDEDIAPPLPGEHTPQAPLTIFRGM